MYSPTFSKSSQLNSQPQSKKKVKRKKLITLLDDEIRRILSKDNQCFTCGVKRSKIGSYGVEGNKIGLQVGHYVSRKVYALRWDLKNVCSQCSYCNGKHRFDQLDYTVALADKYGMSIFKYFKDKRDERKGKTFKTTEMRELLEQLKQLEAKPI